MKNVWVRVLILIFIIGVISVAFSFVIGSRQSIIPFSEIKNDQKLFRLVSDKASIIPSPKMRSASAIVVDLDDGKILLSKDADSVRSIASLTKLATALVFLNTKPNMAMIDSISLAERQGAGRSRLRVGSKATLHDIFHLMLICSDNCAARVIAHSTGLADAEFVDKMNGLALSLGLEHTHFADPTGLDPGNVSTAAEMAVILKVALDNEIIKRVISSREFTFRAINGRRTYTLRNTNHLLFGRQDIIGGKTGYISESGYCLAMGFNTDSGKKLAAVLLGAPSSGCRFREAARLVSTIVKSRPLSS